MSKLWEAIKDLERRREQNAAPGEEAPRDAAGERERQVAYLEEIRGKWRRHAPGDDER